MKTFEEFLRDKHAEQYNGLDDPMSDDCDRWMEDLDVQEVIDFAEEWGKGIAIDEYRKGFNQCLKDEKIPNEFGQKSL